MTTFEELRCPTLKLSHVPYLQKQTRFVFIMTRHGHDLSMISNGVEQIRGTLVVRFYLYKHGPGTTYMRARRQLVRGDVSFKFRESVIFLLAK